MINTENISPPKKSVYSCLLERSLKGRWSHLLDMKVALNTRENAVYSADFDPVA